MNNQTHALALRIALILEEASPKELAEAINILRQNGYRSDLLKFLSESPRTNRQKPEKRVSSVPKASKPIDQVTSKAVLDLEKSAPEKHKILAEFDRLVRQKKVLPTNESLRRFGEKVSKNFRPRSARKDNISAVMAVLAPMPLGDIEMHVKGALDNSPRGAIDEYRNLANYLMHGRREDPT